MKKFVFLCLTAMVFLLNAQNYCLDFDGVNDYVQTNLDVQPSAIPVTTWEAWVKPSRLNYPLYQAILTDDDGGWDRGMFLTPDSDELTIGYGGGGWNTGLSFTEDSWYHIAVVYKTDNVLFYFNGVEYSLGIAPTGQATTRQLSIGAGMNGANNWFQGCIDEVRIWNVVRTEQEIQDNMYHELTGTESGLVSYYKFEEGSGIIAGDSSGSNDGTLVNMDDTDWVLAYLIKPEIDTLLPSDNSTDIGLDQNLEIIFDRNVTAGAGNLTICRTLDDFVVETISATSTIINGSIVTIDPTNSFDFNTGYYVLVDSTAFRNGSGPYFDGIYDKTIWDFTTENYTRTFSPSDNSTYIGLDENLVIIFDRNVTADTGNITICRTSDDSVVETIAVTATVITDSTVTIDPMNFFDFNTGYYVLVDSTAFHNGSGAYFDGIYDKTIWDFTTENYIRTLAPADNSSEVSLETDLQAVFNTEIFAGTGNITLYRTSDDSVVETIAVTSTIIVDSTVTIDILNTSEFNTGYYVLIDSTCFHNGSGLYFEGIYDKTIWNYQTFNQFSDIGAGLTGVDEGDGTWGDYDNDGDLDILLTGSGISKIYNNASGNFTDIEAGLPGFAVSSVAWGDYDNDGDLDIVLSGASGSDPISRIYRNDSGVFNDIAAGLTGVFYSSVAWGDYDNDGDLDILLAGQSYSGEILEVYRNDSGSFTDIGAGLPGVTNGNSAWGDYDNDGDLDILLTGYTGSERISKIYNNDSGTFQDIGAGLTGVFWSASAWGDYDNDGDLDLLLTGRYYDGSWNYISKIYRNDSGSFTDIGAGLPGFAVSSIAWGDYDNDGDLDILLAEYGISKIYRNDSGNFTDIGVGLLGGSNGSVAWGDYDNDGDLDILSTGSSGSGYISKIYRNNSIISNSAPSKPTDLFADFESDLLKFSTGSCSDIETPQAGLSCNFYIEIDSIIVKSSMADTTTGFRKIAAIGNASQNKFYYLDIHNIILPQEDKLFDISWKVQAIDHCFAGSEFASIDTTMASGNLKTIVYNEMEASDILTWEYLFPDSIATYQLQLDDDINFESPIEEIIYLNKKKDSKIINYSIALNELTDFHSLVSNTRYYWRVKPNYIYRTSRYPETPASFIYNPSYSAPSPVNIAVDGDYVTLRWNIEKDAEKGEVYNVYSSDDPHAVFPEGWTKVAVAYTNEWTVKTSERKKFYCVTAAGVTKDVIKKEVKKLR